MNEPAFINVTLMNRWERAQLFVYMKYEAAPESEALSSANHGFGGR
jgi:hypothetical protein